MAQGGRIAFEFTDRTGGVSRAPFDTLNLGGHVGDEPADVAENRRRAVPGPSAWMRQVHGSTVAVVTGPNEADPPEADALVTDRPGLSLVVLVADCVPVLLADPDAGVVAAVHSGRRGVHANVSAAAVAEMVRLGARPERTLAWVGPRICGGCYELPAEVADEVSRRVPAARAATRSGTPAVDIGAGVRAQLADCGLLPGAVHVDPRCTAEEPLLYSYRRDGRTGRFAGVIRLLDPAG